MYAELAGELSNLSSGLARKPVGLLVLPPGVTYLNYYPPQPPRVETTSDEHYRFSTALIGGYLITDAHFVRSAFRV